MLCHGIAARFGLHVAQKSAFRLMRNGCFQHADIGRGTLDQRRSVRPRFSCPLRRPRRQCAIGCSALISERVTSSSSDRLLIVASSHRLFGERPCAMGSP